MMFTVIIEKKPGNEAFTGKVGFIE